MKRLLILLILVIFPYHSNATDFNPTDQMYGWNGSSQFYQTWQDHLIQLQSELTFTEVVQTVNPTPTGSTDAASSEAAVADQLVLKVNNADLIPVEPFMDTFLQSTNVGAAQQNLDLEIGVDVLSPTGDGSGLTGVGGSSYVDTPPTYSNEECIAGNYAIDPVTERLYLCAASGDWNYVVYTDWTNLQGALTALPLSWDPADAVEGTAAVSETITFTAVNQTITFSSISLGGSNFFTDAGTGTCTSSTVLTDTQSCTVDLGFSYILAGGPYSDTLTISSDLGITEVSLGPTTVSSSGGTVLAYIIGSETVGSTAMDPGNGNVSISGTIANTTDHNGTPDSAFYSSGNADQITFTSDANINPTVGSWEIWITGDAPPSYPHFFAYDDGSDNTTDDVFRCYRFNTDFQIRCQLNNVTYNLVTTTDMYTTTPTHVAVSWDYVTDQLLRVYVNGILEDTETLTGSAPTLPTSTFHNMNSPEGASGMSQMTYDSIRTTNGVLPVGYLD